MLLFSGVRSVLKYINQLELLQETCVFTESTFVLSYFADSYNYDFIISPMVLCPLPDLREVFSIGSASTSTIINVVQLS